MPYVRLFISGLCYVMLALTAQGQEETSNFWERENLLGDLGRERLYDSYGLIYEMVYTGEYFNNVLGGINTHNAGEYRGDISIFLSLDTEKAGLWEDGLFFMHLQEQHGRGLTNDHVGDFQVLSNLDADDFKQVSEIWYQHWLMDERLRIKVGKIESNADFAFVNYGLEFINSSPGFSPTIPLVTYPDPDWGMVMEIKHTGWFSSTWGMFQGEPDGGRAISNTLDNLKGPMLMTEHALHYELGSHPGDLRLGGWWNGAAFEQFDTRTNTLNTFDDSYGFYITWDQLAWMENPGEDDGQGVGVFGQYGWAPDDRSEANHYLGGGLQWTGVIPGQDEDVMGLGVFYVDFSDNAGFTDSGETAIEAFYKWQASGWMSIKPDIQYIINPGGSGADDALALGVRWEVVF